jgi:uncharacterized protein (TIGR01244 family)
MSSFRDLAPDFAVAPQIALEALGVAKTEGFTLVISNRPDGEEAGQPSADQVAAAAAAQGLAFRHIPITAPTLEAVEATQAAIAEAGGPVFAFCRSGTRSATLWALARARSGDNPIELLDAARKAGYDLSNLAPTLQRLADGA